MGHRHLSNTFQMFEIDQDQSGNHITAEQSYIHMGRAVAPENRSFVYPVENMFTDGVHCASQWNLESRSNEYSSSSFSMQAPHFRPAVSGPSYDHFQHSSDAGNFYMAPENNAGHAHSNYYNRHAVHDIEAGLLNPTIGTGRGLFKRKSPGISVAFERGSTSRFYSAGSSSSSSELQLEKPTSYYQNTPSGPICLPHYRGSSLSIAGEDSLRNVRSRSRLDLEPNMLRTHMSSYASHHYHSTTHPISHSATVNLANLNADATMQELNCMPLFPAAHGRISNSDTNGLSNVTNQFLVGGIATDIGGYRHDSIANRNTVSPSQYLHGPPAQTARDSRSNHSRRAIPSYRAGMSYPRLGHEAVSSENGLRLLSETYSSRYSRPSSVGAWRNSYRNGRSRAAIERFQSLSNAVGAHDRVGAEALMMVDRPSMYGSRNLFDQYRDMSLDVDNMSYEELLALGERIGNVSTGLSEDMISKCLMEKMYCSSDQIHEEGTCAICLEEYKNKEEVGTLNNCGHDYHVGCIRKWLMVKNVCPICKAPALKDSSEEK